MTRHASQVCVGCALRVPPLDEDSSLVSIKYGWRLTKRQGPDGESIPEWRCPTCWREYRDATGVHRRKA